MKLSLINVYQDDAMLRRVFSWLSRIGASPKFGTRPISWYQIHQCAAIDYLLRLNIFEPVCKDGMIHDRKNKTHVVSASRVFSYADSVSRQ